MNLIEARSQLLAGEPVAISESSFEIASAISEAFNNDPEDTAVQEAVLLALETRSNFNGEENYLNDIARELGLFPYLEQGRLSAADRIAYQYHSIEPLGVVLHAPQARVYREIMAGHNVLLSAPTSFGKSLIVDAVLSSNKFKNVLVVVPTLALMDETRRRLTRLPIPHKVITSSLQDEGEENVFVLTQERALEQDERLKEIDLLVIDEFYKLDSQREEDGTRAEILNSVFYRHVKRSCQYYLLGPSVSAVTEDLGRRTDYKFILETYQTVVSIEQDVHLADEGDEFDRLEELCTEISGPSIIYTQSVPRCMRAAASIEPLFGVEHEFSDRLESAVEWISEYYHPDWTFVRALKTGIGIHHGRIPRSLAQVIVRYFEEGLLSYLVCTSSMIEGVNTRAQNIIVLDKNVNQTEFDLFTFNNIKGRAGRMFKHFVGHIYLFHTAPEQQQLPFIDIPAFSQSELASESLLLQLDKEDLKENSKLKLDWIYEQGVLNPETIKLNAGVDPQDQIAFAEELLQDLPAAVRLCSWQSGRPSYEQLQEICRHMWETFGMKKTRSGVRSYRQLTQLINILSRRQSISDFIMAQIDYFDDEDIDQHMDDVLSFLRNWAGFHFPKVLRAMNNIQLEILAEYTTSDFQGYATQVECWFRDPVASALEEFGIPIQLSDKLSDDVLVPGDLDATLESIRLLDLEEMRHLHPFELELLADFQQSL